MDIKKEIGSMIIGLEKTMKALQKNELSHIYVAKNCPDATIADLKAKATLGSVPLTKLTYPNNELGVICKKPFSISVLGKRA